MVTLGAAKVKAHLLRILEEVAATREPVIVTKKGRTVARIVPMPVVDEDPIFGFYQDKLDIVGDVLSSLYTDDELDGFVERSAAQLG